jgi:phage gp45-like
MSSRNVVARLLHAVSLGRITIVDDTGPIQKLQVTGSPGPDGTLAVSDGVLLVGQFGFSSSPPLTSEVVLIRLWGNRTLTIAIGTNHQPSRIKNLKAGETVVYNVMGAKVYLSAQGVVIDGAGMPMKIQNVGEMVSIDATLTCSGDVIANGGSDPISLATHTHGLTGGANTTAPLPGS